MRVVSQLITMKCDTLRFIITRYDASDSDAYKRILARFSAMYAIKVGQRGQRAVSYSALSQQNSIESCAVI